MPIERTLIIIKPDAVNRAIVGEIIKTMQEVFEKLRTGYVLKRLQKQIAVV